MRYDRNDANLACVAALAGVKVDSGMVNAFNDMQRAGKLKNALTIGAMHRAWLLHQLAVSLDL